VLSSAVTRSVSVTDFLSSLADPIKPGVRCIQLNRRVLSTIDSATVIARIWRFKMANHRPREEFDIRPSVNAVAEAAIAGRRRE
jgi:hypothetical protein